MKKNSVDIMKIREFFQKYGYNPRAKKDSGVDNLYFTVFVLVLKKEGSMIKYDCSGLGHGFWFWLCRYVTVMCDHHYSPNTVLDAVLIGGLALLSKMLGKRRVSRF